MYSGGESKCTVGGQITIMLSSMREQLRGCGKDDHIGPGKWPVVVRHSTSLSLGGHEYRARSKRRTILAQHAKSVKHCVANGLQAATAKQLPTRALSQGAKLKNTCRTVQVLPEYLRLSTIPTVHCNVATKGVSLGIQDKLHSPNGNLRKNMASEKRIVGSIRLKTLLKNFLRM